MNDFLPRENLMEQVCRAIDRHALTVVVAPVGYGKTTVARAVPGRTGGHELFLDIQPGTRDLGRLWAALVRQAGTMNMPLPVGMRADAPPATPKQAARLLSRLSPDSRPVVIILDNFHLVDAPGTDAFLEEVARCAYPGLRLAVFSRKWPTMRLDDMVEQGIAVLFDKRLLTFSLAETTRYFEMRGFFHRDTAEDVWKTSGGWPAYVWAASRHAWASGKGRQPPDLDVLLWKALLSVYSREERTLLMRVSVVDDFSADEAVRLAGDGCDAAAIRDFLARDPIVIQDDATGRYVLNPFTRSFLRREAASDLDIDPADLSRAGAECMAGRGDAVVAFRLFMEAGGKADVAKAFDLFLSPVTGTATADTAENIHAAIQSIPWEVRCEHPLGYVASLWLRLLFGMDAEKITRLTEEAEYQFIVAGTVPSGVTRRLRGELALLHGCLSVHNGPVSRKDFQDARDLLDGPSAMRHWLRMWGRCFLNLSFFLLTGREKYGDVVNRFSAAAEALDIFAGGGFAEMGAAFQGEYYLERGEFARATAYFHSVGKDGPVAERTVAPAPACFGAARLLAVAGRYEEASELLETFRSTVTEPNPGLQADDVDILSGYLYAGYGFPIPAPERTRERAKRTPEYTWTPRSALAAVVYGKTLLAAGEDGRLETAARTLPLLFGSNFGLLGRIHCKIFEAICAWHMAGTREGVLVFEEAVSLARPDGIVLSLAEYGGYVTPLLQALTKRYPKDRYLGRVHDVAKTVRRRGVQGGNHYRILSHREREVMRLVAGGLSNKAIGNALGISDETVKKHVNAIFVKLGVSNRSQAVRQFSIRSNG